MSLSKAKTKKYGSNDRILLKCGDTFYEQVAFNIEAEDNQYCLISSYGDGEMPVIDMSKIVSNANLCETYSNGIYKIDLSNKNNFDGYVGDNYKSCNIGFFTDSQENIFTVQFFKLLVFLEIPCTPVLVIFKFSYIVLLDALNAPTSIANFKVPNFSIGFSTLFIYILFSSQ